MVTTTTTCVVGAPLVVARSRRSPTTLKCFASTANSELLRSQLDRLHAEAESTRAKANSNRLRLLRLSEAAENLRRQASVHVQTGKENEARELLLQKKKVMQALDKAKARIELLDTLSSKLNEAISVKETQLIGNISLDLEVDSDDSTSDGVHIVSPKPESTQQNDLDSQENQLTENNFEETDNHVLEEALTGSIFKEMSSYESFLENLDKKLGRIEDELVTVVNVASLVLGNEDKPKNLKVQQTVEILEEIRSVRERIASIICKEANIS
ncbi:Forkhead-associated domain protein [Hirschfeldia incana]|nr:Forkhead-associated domain protein [Hirschfeldia incana]